MLEKIKRNLRYKLTTKRYEHTLGVYETALDLATLYRVDTYKVSVAALLHDCAKDLSEEYMKELLSKHNIKLSFVEENNKSLWHALLGAVMAEKEYGITDEEILSAIRVHTTGNEKMSTIDKIIYIADYIEPSRNFEGIEELRALAWQNLDQALLKAYNITISYILTKGLMLDLKTVSSRNRLLHSLKIC